MISKSTAVNAYKIAGLFILAFAYGLFYFNYFETPTGDFIGQHRVMVESFLKGDFTLISGFGFLPVFHIVLAALTSINPLTAPDRIYQTSILLNITLFIPYLILVYGIYKKFLFRWHRSAAFIFLTANIYTVYAAVNAELEMLQSFLIVLTIFLAMKDSKWSYFTSFFTAMVKWDSVFAVPAAAFRDFFFKRKYLLSILLGAVASSGIVLLFILNMLSENTYVGEIASRGPNIYRYFIDCLLVTSSFAAWMGMDAYFSESVLLKITFFTVVFFIGLLIIVNIIWGIVLLIRRQWKDSAPAFVFLSGFLLVHIVYQNTKSRYVLSILWLLVLFLFYGFYNGFLPWIAKYISNFTDNTRIRLQSITGIILLLAYFSGIIALFLKSWSLALFALAFTFAFGFVLKSDTGDWSRKTFFIVILAGGTLLNPMFYYGKNTMDHYSLRRVEFKKAGLWYRENYRTGDRLMITEVPVTRYYSGFKDKRFQPAGTLRSKNLKDLVKELKRVKVTLVFVDDFYIRRLKVKDKNAINKNAELLREIRDHGANTGHFKLIRTFISGDNFKSYLYRFVP